MSKTYADKLKDPRWQRKRLEVMENASWECLNCGSKDSELQVHHPAYLKGKEPWEYDESQLECLCKDCHKVRTDALRFWNLVMLNDPGGSGSMLECVMSGRLDEAISMFADIVSNYYAKTGASAVAICPDWFPEYSVASTACKMNGVGLKS